MRVDAERREDAFLPLGDLERRAARLDPRADGDHAPDARFAGAPKHLGGVLVARVEVRMRVDHAASGRAASMRSQLLGLDLPRIELAEQRLRLSQRLAGRQARSGAHEPTQLA